MSDKSTFEAELRKQAEHHGLKIEVLGGRNTEDDALWLATVSIEDKRFSLFVSEYGKMGEGRPFGANTIAGHSPNSLMTWFHLFNHAAGDLFKRHDFIRFGRLNDWDDKHNPTYYNLATSAHYTQMSHEPNNVVRHIDTNLYTPLVQEPIAQSVEHHCPWFKPLSGKVKSLEFTLLEAQIKQTLARTRTVRMVGAAVAIERESWAVVCN